MYLLLKRKRNPLQVFWIDGRNIHSLYANCYFSVASTKVYDDFINGSDVNVVPPAIAKRSHSSIRLKMSAIGRCEEMDAVRQVVFTCNASGIMCPYD